MKLKHILLILVIMTIPITNYLLYIEYTSLSSEDFTELINNTGYGVFLILCFIISCILTGSLLIILLINNWDKKITINSILKTIKSIKLN